VDILDKLKIKPVTYSKLSEGMQEQNEYRKNPKINFVFSQVDKDQSDVQ
jgi:hypothetical protein